MRGAYQICPLLCCVISLMLVACGDGKHPHEAALTKEVSDTRSSPSAEPIRSDLPTGVVAQADRITITKRTLDHWIKVQAVLQYQLRPTRPVPKGVVPVPPLYRDCTSLYLAMNAKAARSEKPANVAQLKSECAQQYEALLKHSMERSSSMTGSNRNQQGPVSV